MSGRQSSSLCLAFSSLRTAPVNRQNLLTSSTTVRLLDLIKPSTPLLPEVSAPETKISFNQTFVRDFLELSAGGHGS